MDILTHICSGIAGATVVAAFAKKQPVRRLQILASGAAGGAMPDIDAVSMWSHFDTTFGRWFNLSHSGRIIYGEKFWYSHHAFFHSIVASLLLALFFGLLSYGIACVIHKKAVNSFYAYCTKNTLIIISFFAGYILHLLGDMPTPASVWGGVNLFFPHNAYIGGSGKIWWWNNYDIFLLLVVCIAVNSFLIPVFKRHIQRIVVVSVVLLTFLLVEIQINTRQYNYAYSGNAPHYAEMEQHSKEEQQRILGKPLYSAIEWLDRHLPFHF
jgi:membrane-bound metal-dependent hydrolase YbcI (DUF457 family)